MPECAVNSKHLARCNLAFAVLLVGTSARLATKRHGSLDVTPSATLAIATSFRARAPRQPLRPLAICLKQNRAGCRATSAQLRQCALLAGLSIGIELVHHPRARLLPASARATAARPSSPLGVAAVTSLATRLRAAGPHFAQGPLAASTIALRMALHNAHVRGLSATTGSSALAPILPTAELTINGLLVAMRGALLSLPGWAHTCKTTTDRSLGHTAISLSQAHAGTSAPHRPCGPLTRLRRLCKATIAWLDGTDTDLLLCASTVIWVCQ